MVIFRPSVAARWGVDQRTGRNERAKILYPSARVLAPPFRRSRFDAMDQLEG